MNLDWQKFPDALVPAIVQDAQTRAVLMLGYMNEESLLATQKTGKVTFYSRSRKSQWVKGETSGNFLHVVEILPDCDQDALLILANPEGPTCHRGTTTCFADFLHELESVIASRRKEQPEKSYIAKLFAEGLDRIIQKVGEEAIETVIAAKNTEIAEFESESADLLFHLLVLLNARGSSLDKILEVLKARHQKRK